MFRRLHTKFRLPGRPVVANSFVVASEAKQSNLAATPSDSWTYYFSHRKELIERSDDPIKKIRDKNKGLSNLKENYIAYHPQLQMGISLKWGDRDYQQDRAVGARLEGFEKVPDDKKPDVLKTYVKTLQDRITAEIKKGGSTLSIAIVCGTKIYTAHVGDSPQYIVILNKEGKVINNCQRLFKKLHHPKRERKRLKNYETFIENNRMYTQDRSRHFALSRAMGDNHLEKSGLIHKPELNKCVLELKDGDMAFVLTLSDGVKLNREEIQNVFKNNSKKLPHEIANELTKAARQKEIKKAKENNTEVRGDNRTAIVTLVTPTSATAIYQAVFDGHTNDLVSDLLYENSTAVLNQAIEDCLAVHLLSCQRQLASR